MRREQSGPAVFIVICSNSFEFLETPMKTSSIMLAALAALTLGSVASAQQPMTGTVTRIDRIDGTIAIQLQKTPTQSSTMTVSADRMRANP